ncbi:MAG: hypothetical protein HQL90_07320 [Magnetococcales bacterium]|nr:hypothetical protein [Magnetococcales bacterium]
MSRVHRGFLSNMAHHPPGNHPARQSPTVTVSPWGGLPGRVVGMITLGGEPPGCDPM